MTRFYLLNPDDYDTQAKLAEDLERIATYLAAAEYGNYTVAELLAKIFGTDGNLQSAFLELRWYSNKIQYRLANGTWFDLTGADQAALQGPAGVSGSGTGDMVRATYDPDNDGKIANAQLALTDNGIAQTKITNLTTDLGLRGAVYAQATAPSSPTYPPAGPVTLWLDTSTLGTPVLKMWDGVASWLTVSGSTTSTSSNAGFISPFAGETIANRAVVFQATKDVYDTVNLATGGTAAASAGTAANAFDTNPATSCDTGATNGNISYDFTTAKTVAQCRILFSAATLNMALAIEVSSDNVSWTTVRSIAASNFDGNFQTIINISSPQSARYWRIRQTGGTDNMVVRTITLHAIKYKKGFAYNVETDLSPIAMSDIVGIALGAGTSGSRVSIQTGPGEITGFSISSGALYYTGTTLGVLTTTPVNNSVFLGEAKSAAILNFNPIVPRVTPGTVETFMGAIADLPHDRLLLDGASISREEHPLLFAKLGTKYGAGDGVTTFRIPDARDRFILAATQDDAGVAKTNYTGSLLSTGGNRSQTTSATAAGVVTTGGGGANVAEGGVPTTALQISATHTHTVNLDAPFYAFAMTVKGG